jgi:hypothetical protein
MSNTSTVNELPIIDVFDPPYKIWSQRALTKDEQLAYYEEHKRLVFEKDDQLLKSIDSAYSAAAHMSEVRADNALENFINDALANSSAMAAVRRIMPAKTPKNLSRYQTHYPYYDADGVGREIREHGAILGNGQLLFHGGGWPDGVNQFETVLPLSSSFCPQVALRNAEFKGKAYDLGRVDLVVLKATDPKCQAYVFGAKGQMKHEKEVVFAAGAQLKLVKRTFIQQVTVAKVDEHMDLLYALVPAYVIEAEIS